MKRPGIAASDTRCDHCGTDIRYGDDIYSDTTETICWDCYWTQDKE